MMQYGLVVVTDVSGCVASMSYCGYGGSIVFETWTLNYQTRT